MLPCQSGRGAARLARLHGVQEVGGSNPLAPTGKTLARESFDLMWSDVSPSGDNANPLAPTCAGVPRQSRHIVRYGGLFYA